jgi:hypothetical protein
MVGLSAPRPTPDLEDQMSLFVWVIILGLSGMGAPASSYPTADIALRTLLPRKPHLRRGQ